MYYQKKWECGVAVAIHQSYSPLMGRAVVKSGDVFVSRPAVKAYNDRLGRQALTRLINANFLPGDGFVTLTYFRGQKPPPEEAVRHKRMFLADLRAAAKAAGVVLRYVYAVALGERGALHHHMIVNREVIQLVARLWGYGSVNVKFLYDKRNYQGLAFYFCGQYKGENPEQPGEKIIVGNRYSTSRNLLRPEDERAVIENGEMEKYPRLDEGYLIDVQSIDAGENPVNGRPYLYYVMLPLVVPPRLNAKLRAAYEGREKAKNAAEVKFVLDGIYEGILARIGYDGAHSGPVNKVRESSLS